MTVVIFGNGLKKFIIIWKNYRSDISCHISCSISITGGCMNELFELSKNETQNIKLQPKISALLKELNQNLYKKKTL